jgi:hypothetical protein
MPERSIHVPVGTMTALLGGALAVLGLVFAMRPLRDTPRAVAFALPGSLISAGALLVYQSSSRMREERLHRTHVRTTGHLTGLDAVERARLLHELARERSERFAL